MNDADTVQVDRNVILTRGYAASVTDTDCGAHGVEGHHVNIPCAGSLHLKLKGTRALLAEAGCYTGEPRIKDLHTNGHVRRIQ